MDTRSSERLVMSRRGRLVPALPGWPSVSVEPVPFLWCSCAWKWYGRIILAVGLNMTLRVW